MQLALPTLRGEPSMAGLGGDEEQKGPVFCETHTNTKVLPSPMGG